MVGLIQRNWSGGELGEALAARADLTKHATGASLMRNFFVTKTGAAANRIGTEFIAATRDNTEYERLIEFVFNSDQAYGLLFGDEYVRIISQGAYLMVAAADVGLHNTAGFPYVVGHLVKDASGNVYYCVARHTSTTGNEPTDSGATPDLWYPLTEDPDNAGSFFLELPTQYAEEDLEALHHSPTGDIVRLTHPSYSPYELRRLGATWWTLLPVDVGPNMTPPVGIAFTNSGAAGNHTLRYQVSARRKETREESVPGGDGTAVGPDDITTPVAGEDLNVESVGHGLADGDLIVVTLVGIQAPLAPNEEARILLENKTFAVTTDGADDFTLDGTADLLFKPALAVFFPAIEITWHKAFVELTSVKVPKGDGTTKVSLSWTAVADAEEYLVYRSIDNGKYGLLGSTKTLAWDDQGQQDAAIPVEADEEFPPKTYRNPFVAGKWPSTVGYSQQRLVFAGSEEAPQKFHMSRTGDFKDFTTHDPITDSDAFAAVLASRRGDSIGHLVDLGQLIFFTTGAIWNIRGDADGTITPTQVNAEPMSYAGASSLQAVIVDDSVLFTEALGSVVRELRFNIGDGGFQGYTGRELSPFASHLFDGHTIKQWAFARVPHSLVLAVRDDGALLGLTYLHEHDIWAWSRHDTGDGDDAFQSIISIPENGVDVFYAIVRRKIDGSTVRYVERIGARQVGHGDIDDRVASRFLDCHLVFDGTNETATTLTLTGGTTWAAGETLLTLTASGATFPGNGTNVGNGYRLRVLALDTDALSATYKQYIPHEVEVIVTADGSTTVQTVSLLTAAPVATRGVATASWVFMVDELSGLEHLEGETVGICADLNDLGTATVSSGVVPALARPYGVICVGLPIRAELATLDVDLVNQADTPADKRKIVRSATLWLEKSAGLKVGRAGKTLDAVPLKSGETASTLLTRKALVHYAGDWDDNGRVLIRQDAPLPVTVTAVAVHVEFGGRG